jgi:hypothetical protein
VAGDITSGAWTAHQSNRWDVRFNLDQTGGNLSGEADATPLDGGAGMHGTLDSQGSLVQGETVQIVVDWDPGPKGKYIGNFDFSNRLSGHSFDLNHPSSQALWFSEETF